MIFMGERYVTSPRLQAGNYSIKFHKIDEFHKIKVRNPSLLFEPFQSAQCRLLFRETTLVLLAWQLPAISSSPLPWSVSSTARDQV